MREKRHQAEQIVKGYHEGFFSYVGARNALSFLGLDGDTIMYRVERGLSIWDEEDAEC